MAAEQKEALTGAQKAAILLLTLGEEDAASILKHLGARDVQAVGTAMAALKNVTKEQVDHVLTKLREDVGQHTSIGVGTEEYIRRILGERAGREQGRRPDRPHPPRAVAARAWNR